MRSLRVLVVDDEPLVCEMVSECLRDEGWDVVCAEDAPAALQADGVDLAVIDAVLPGQIDGMQLADLLGAEGIGVMLMSGEAEALERASASGRRVLAKPFRIAALVDELRRLAELRPVPRTAGSAAC
jgi:CheY-like chemotaxis protein